MSETMQEREPKWWTCHEDAERLTCDDISEAIHAWAEDTDGDAPLPETVMVYGFAPMALPTVDRIVGRWGPLDRLLEDLDEEHADPDDNGPSQTTEVLQAMQAAERAFVSTVLANYKSWSCERVASREVRVADYLTPEEIAEYNNIELDASTPVTP